MSKAIFYIAIVRDSVYTAMSELKNCMRKKRVVQGLLAELFLYRLALRAMVWRPLHHSVVYRCYK